MLVLNVCIPFPQLGVGLVFMLQKIPKPKFPVPSPLKAPVAAVKLKGAFWVMVMILGQGHSAEYSAWSTTTGHIGAVV
jgi:hypothetical protein